MNYERLMLDYLGGHQLMSSLMGKTINSAQIDQVYDYVCPREKFDAPRP